MRNPKTTPEGPIKILREDLRGEHEGMQDDPSKDIPIELGERQTQPLANIMLKMSREGSSVALKNVTPAEVMLLCAMHSSNAGGMPILRSEIIPSGYEQQQALPYKEEMENLQAQLDKVYDDANRVTAEVIDKRILSLNDRIRSLESIIQGYAQTATIRYLSPEDEKARLGQKYLQPQIEKLYPGFIPANFPKTFKQARKFGQKVDVGPARFLNNPAIEVAA
jgi:hypothetical protein